MKFSSCLGILLAMAVSSGVDARITVRLLILLLSSGCGFVIDGSSRPRSVITFFDWLSHLLVVYVLNFFLLYWYLQTGTEEVPLFHHIVLIFCHRALLGPTRRLKFINTFAFPLSPIIFGCFVFFFFFYTGPLFLLFSLQRFCWASPGTCWYCPMPTFVQMEWMLTMK